MIFQGWKTKPRFFLLGGVLARLHFLLNPREQKKVTRFDSFTPETKAALILLAYVLDACGVFVNLRV